MTTTKTSRLRRLRALVASAGTIAVALLVATGCADDSATGSASTPDSGTKTIQFVNPLPNYPAWKETGRCMAEEADKRGVTLKQSGPTGQAIDANAMIQQVQQATANKVDGIITFPTSEGFAPVLKQAQAADVVTGTVYGAGGPESGADYNVGVDFTYIGKSLVEAVAKLPGKHVLGLVAAGNTGLGKAWMTGVKEAAAKTDNVTIAGEVYTGDDAAKALPQVNALLSANPDVTQIVTHMGTTTPGATAAIKAKGRVGKTFLLAGGSDNGGSEALDEGTANLMLMQDVCGLGRQLLNGVVDVMEGKTPAEAPVRIAVIDKSKLQAYLDKGWV